MLVDSHCHLNFPEFKDSFYETIARANDSDVRILQTICTQARDFPELVKLTSLTPNLYCSFGIHPCHADELTYNVTANMICSVLTHKKVIGIGEAGLDYHYSPDNKTLQQQLFVEHILAAQLSGLPLIIHTRDAEADTYKILKEHMDRKPFKAILHCFTGSLEFAKQCLELGCYISFSGIITFKNASTLREVVAYVPLERMLIETDSPYLAPMPYRGKPNEPSYVKHVAETIADVKLIGLSQVADETTRNFLKLFNKVVWE